MPSKCLKSSWFSGHLSQLEASYNPAPKDTEHLHLKHLWLSIFTQLKHSTIHPKTKNNHMLNIKSGHWKCNDIIIYTVYRAYHWRMLFSLPSCAPQKASRWGQQGSANLQVLLTFRKARKACSFTQAQKVQQTQEFVHHIHLTTCLIPNVDSLVLKITTYNGMLRDVLRHKTCHSCLFGHLLVQGAEGIIQYYQGHMPLSVAKMDEKWQKSEKHVYKVQVDIHSIYIYESTSMYLYIYIWCIFIYPSMYLSIYLCIYLFIQYTCKFTHSDGF